MKSCFASVSQNVGILTTSGLVFQEYINVHFQEASQPNYSIAYRCSFTHSTFYTLAMIYPMNSFDTRDFPH